MLDWKTYLVGRVTNHSLSLAPRSRSPSHPKSDIGVRALRMVKQPSLRRWDDRLASGLGVLRQRESIFQINA